MALLGAIFLKGTWEISYSDNGASVNEDLDIQWYLYDDDTFIHIVYKDNNNNLYVDDYKIVKLKKDEMILEDAAAGLYTYVAK